MTESTHYTETPEAFKVYCDYIAIKTHFKDDDYNYFERGGGVSATTKSYSKRKDREQFYALSRMKHPERRILAHVLNNPDVWIRDIVENDKPYRAWLKRQESFFYSLKNDISRYDDLAAAIRVVDGESVLLSDFLAGDISLDTVTALDIATNVMEFWKLRITEDRLFPALYKKVRKYKPFLNLDKSKVLSTIRNN